MNRKNDMLHFMDSSEFQVKYQDVVEKMRQGRELSRQERTILLLAQLIGRETRQESRYGQI